jgi:hypothetical protein
MGEEYWCRVTVTIVATSAATIVAGIAATAGIIPGIFADF